MPLNFEIHLTKRLGFFFMICDSQNLSQILLKFTRFSTGNTDWTRLWVTDGIRMWLHTCERLWACLVTTRPSGSRSRWSWRMFLSCEVLTPILQLKSLQIRWESCEFKSVTGSLVTLVLKLKTAWIWVRFVRDFGDYNYEKNLSEGPYEVATASDHVESRATRAAHH